MLVIVLGGSLLTVELAAAERVRLAFFDIEYPPLQIRVNDQLIGADRELVEEVFRRTPNFELDAVLLPIARSFKDYSAGSIDVIHTYKSRSVSQFTIYSQRPIRSALYQLLVKKNKPLNYQSPADLAGLRVVTLRAINLQGELKNAEKDGLIKITRVANHEQALQMLYRGRVDAVYMYGDVARYYARKIGFSIVPINNYPGNLRGFHLAISKRSSIKNYNHLHQEVSLAIESMYADGTQKAIMDRYIIPENSPDR